MMDYFAEIKKLGLSCDTAPECRRTIARLRELAEAKGYPQGIALALIKARRRLRELERGS